MHACLLPLLLTMYGAELAGAQSPNACLLPLLLTMYGAELASAQKYSYNCSESKPFGDSWKFHCFDRQNCLFSDIQICQNHLDPKCPDKSDQLKHFCQRVGMSKFYCCDGSAVMVEEVCDGKCQCFESCDDEDVCANKLQCNWSVRGMSIGIIITITLSVFFFFMVMVLCAICFFCFKCLDVVRGWRHPEEPLSSARQLVGDKNLPSGPKHIAPVARALENEGHVELG